jgi:Xaa-Pro aminopeptidase
MSLPGAERQTHQAEGAVEEPDRSYLGAGETGTAARARHSAPMKYAGKSAEDKIAELQATLKKDGQDAVILTFPDSIAWLFNIRGSDVAHNPVALAFRHRAVERQGRAVHRCGQDRPGGQIASGVAGKDHEPASLERRIAALKAGGQVHPTESRRGALVLSQAEGGKARIVRATDPCILPKARKNAAEIKGSRAAHKRDGAAVVRFLAWLDREAPKGGIDEIGAAKQLEAMRAETQALKEISFDTISGAGSNGRDRALSRHHGDQPQAQRG